MSTVYLGRSDGRVPVVTVNHTGKSHSAPDQLIYGFGRTVVLVVQLKHRSSLFLEMPPHIGTRHSETGELLAQRITGFQRLA